MGKVGVTDMGTVVGRVRGLSWEEWGDCRGKGGDVERSVNGSLE